MFRSFFTFLFLSLFVVIFSACSGGGDKNPVSMGASSLPEMSARMPIYVNQASENVIAGTGMLGLYQMTIDTKNLAYEIVPARTSSFVPSEYEVDLTTALTSTFCTDCFMISSIGLAGNGNLLLEVGVRHPFPRITSIPAPKPQRPDLHVFDVQGIVIFDGKKSFSRAGVTLNPTFVVNADGYTTAFDSVIDSLGGSYSTPNANAHAFKILSMGNYTNPGDEVGNYDMYSLNGYPSPSGLMNPTGFNVMKCGSNYKFTQYELDPPTNTFKFFFAVTCSFGESAKGIGTTLQKRGNPVYLLPAFSKPEAWKVTARIENNDLRNNDNTSTAQVVVDVCDWQQAFGGLPANPSFDPSVSTTAPRNTLIKKSGIKIIELDIPGLNNPMDNSSSVVPTGSGSYYSPREFRITVNNDLFASEIPDPNQPPQFYGLIAVRDDLVDTPNPIGGIDRKLGIPDSLFQISDYTTYQLFGISIFPPNDPPVPVIDALSPVTGPPFPIAFDSGKMLDVTGEHSFDTDGSILTYEWDFDYDTATEIFDVDFTNSDPVVAANPPDWKMFNPYDEVRKRFVALRVTDNGPSVMSSVAYIEIDLGPNIKPVASLGVSFYTTTLSPPFEFYQGEKVTLKPGAGLWDDGQITTYQYDFNYDQVTPFFTVDAANTTGNPVLSPVQSQGAVAMAIRIIDNGIPNKNDTKYEEISVLGRAANTPVRVNNAGSTSVMLDNSGNHAIAASDHYVVCAWTQNGNQADIFYSVSNDRGITWGPQTVLNSVTTGTQRKVSMTCRPATDIFYATYETNETGAYIIKYAVSNAGVSAWPLQGVLATSTDTPSDPAIAANTGANQIYVSYIGLDGLGRDCVYTKTSADGGTTWTSRLAVNTSFTGDRTDPSIAFDTTNGRVGAAWDDNRTGIYQVYFNWSNMTGTAWQAADVRVATSAINQNDPSLSTRMGSWILSFDNLVASSDIYFTRSLDGSFWTPAVDCTDNTDSQHNDSSICSDRMGTIYITTTDSRETGNPSDRDVYVFKSTDIGATWKRGVRVDTSPLGSNAFKPNLTGLIGSLDSGFVIMYESPDDAVYCAKSNAY